LAIALDGIRNLLSINYRKFLRFRLYFLLIRKVSESFGRKELSKVGATGFELPPETKGKTHILENSGAKSGAVVENISSIGESPPPTNPLIDAISLMLS
jgi:hypothetical protein